MTETRTRRGGPEAAEGVGFSMTPMIDIVFQLIIFFMLVTDMSRVQVENLAPPVAREVEEDVNPPKERLIVNVMPDGELRAHGRPIRDAEALKGWLADRAARHPRPRAGAPAEVALMIRGDARVPFEHVQKVMQVCGDPQVRIYKLEIGARTPRADAETNDQ